MPELYMGLMSGTSLDGVDAVIADFAPTRPELLRHHTYAIPAPIRDILLQISTTEHASYLQVASLNVQFGQLLAHIAQDLMQQAAVKPEQIIAIGSHGHTLAHRPEDEFPFSVQIGSPQVLTKSTGVTVVADFRPSDIAMGGQGAPFASAFHEFLFADQSVAVINIGGISNTTLIRENKPTLGYDTGPGNCLMDSWIQKQQGVKFDQDGHFAAQGTCDPRLLQQMLTDGYFSQTIPKSTGRDKFNLHWLQAQLDLIHRAPRAEDVQATLMALTIESIAQPLQQVSNLEEILICGGGVHNLFLMSKLAQRLGPTPVSAIDTKGIAADWIEALAFAWLAKRTLAHQPGNVASVTGAKSATILGGIFR